MNIWQQPERARLCSYKEENETSTSKLSVVPHLKLINSRSTSSGSTSRSGGAES